MGNQMMVCELKDKPVWVYGDGKLTEGTILLAEESNVEGTLCQFVIKLNESGEIVTIVDALEKPDRKYIFQAKEPALRKLITSKERQHSKLSREIKILRTEFVSLPVATDHYRPKVLTQKVNETGKVASPEIEATEPVITIEQDNQGVDNSAQQE